MGLGLRFRFMLPWAVAWVLLTAYYFVVWAPEYVQARMNAREFALAHVLDNAGENALDALRRGRDEEARHFLEQLTGGFPNIFALTLKDAAGRTLNVNTDRPAPENPAGLVTFQRTIGKGATVATLSARLDLSATLTSAHAEITRLYAILFVVAIAATTLTGLFVERLLRRPVADLAEAAHALANRRYEFGIAKGVWGYGARLAASLTQVRDLLQEQEAAINREARARKVAEEAVREAQERFLMAVSGASDGTWEWDLKNDTAYFSPRWKSMLGFRMDEIGAHIQEWSDRIHPEDASHVDAALRAHLAGDTPVFESEHRVRKADDSDLRVFARGSAVRSPSGSPLRLVGLLTDSADKKRVEAMLKNLSAGLAPARSAEFLQTLVRNFARVLEVPCAFITECMDDKVTRVRTLAFWNKDGFMDNEEYDLAGTPCDLVINAARVGFYRRGVGDMFARQQGFESYLGIPLLDSAGAVVGHLACLDTRDMPEDLPLDAIFRLYSVRAGLELERRRAVST